MRKQHTIKRLKLALRIKNELLVHLSGQLSNFLEIVFIAVSRLVAE